MDKDRIEGAGKEIKGGVKEKVLAAVGDQKTEAEGRGEKVEGKVQNPVGGVKDTARDVLKGRYTALAFMARRPRAT